jgi:hypothetical protein
VVFKNLFHLEIIPWISNISIDGEEALEEQPAMKKFEHVCVF